MTGLDAAVVGVGGREGEQRCGRIGEEGRHRLQHRRTVGLEREQIVAAPVEDQLRGLGLSVDRIAGDQHPLEGQRREQGAGGGDLVLARRHPSLPDAQTRVAAEGGDHMQGRAPRRTIERAAQRLAVNGQNAGPVRAQIDQKRLERPPKATGSSSRNTRENVSWLGKPFSSARNSRSRRSRSSANSAKSTQLSAPQTDATSAIVRISRRS